MTSTYGNDVSFCCKEEAEFYALNEATGSFDLVADPVTTYCFISSFASSPDYSDADTVGLITYETTASSTCPDSFKPEKTFYFKVRIKNNNLASESVDFTQEFTYFDPCIEGELRVDTVVTD